MSPRPRPASGPLAALLAALLLAWPSAAWAQATPDPCGCPPSPGAPPAAVARPPAWRPARAPARLRRLPPRPMRLRLAPALPRLGARPPARRLPPPHRLAPTLAGGAPCALPSPCPERPCPPIACALTPEELRVAKEAWAYFQRNLNPRTGLCNATDGYPSVTLWDQASAIFAVQAARRLGLISEAEAAGHLDRMLATLSQLALVDGLLPNKAYHTQSARMVDYANRPSERGIGWSALDLGRLLAALQSVRRCDPVHREAVDRILLSWRYDELIDAQGDLQGAQRRPDGRLVRVQEGRLGYEEYAKRAFQQLGTMPLRPPPRRLVQVEGLEIPVDARDARRLGAHSYVVAESYLLQAFELGLPKPLDDWAERVYEAQKRRSQRTGILTAVSEDHLDRAPHFVYNTVWVDGYPWRAITDKGEDAAAFKSLSTKAAFGYWVLHPQDRHAQALWAAVRLGLEPGKGFYAGRYEDGKGFNRILTCNTNGILLEALLFAKTRQPLSVGAVPPGLFERHRQAHANWRHLPGGHPLAPLPPAPAGPLPEAWRLAAQEAWGWFTRHTDPTTGLVPTRTGSTAGTLAAQADALISLRVAAALGLVSPEEAFARRRRLLHSLLSLPHPPGLPPPPRFTLAGRPVGLAGQPEPEGAWDALELGRLALGLAAAAQDDPALAPHLRAHLASWKPQAWSQQGRLLQRSRQGGRWVLGPVRGFGSEALAAAGLQLWGLGGFTLAPRRFHALEGVEVPVAEAVGSAPSPPTVGVHWAQAQVEFGATGPMGLEAPYVFAAQAQRSASLGWAVGSDEGLVDEAPYQLAEALVSQGREWEAVGPDGKAYPKLRAFTAGPAFLWASLYAHPHAQRSLQSALRLRSELGFRRGAYEEGRLMPVWDARTQALVLEAAWRRRFGTPLAQGWAPPAEGPLPARPWPLGLAPEAGALPTPGATEPLTPLPPDPWSPWPLGPLDPSLGTPPSPLPTPRSSAAWPQPVRFASPLPELAWPLLARPSARPSTAPSGRPAPGPKPTPRPSPTPAANPSPRPTPRPSPGTAPSARPTPSPSTSTAPAARPTPSPRIGLTHSARPSMPPALRPSPRPSTAPSARPSFRPSPAPLAGASPTTSTLPQRPPGPPPPARPWVPRPSLLGGGPWWLGGGRLSYSAAFSMALSAATQGPEAQTQRLRTDVALPPNQGVASTNLQWSGGPWFARGTAFRYLNPSGQQPWHPDFTYAFGYDDWRPLTASLSFEHYGGNRWDGSGATLAQGSLVAGYKLGRLPGWPEGWGDPSLSVSGGLTPRWFDAQGLEQAWKQRAGLRLNYRLWNWFQAWMAPAFYFPQQRQPWDPDVTYGLGLSYTGPLTLNVQYANYGNTRWWSPQVPGAAGFLDGSLSVSVGGSL